MGTLSREILVNGVVFSLIMSLLWIPIFWIWRLVNYATPAILVKIPIWLVVKLFDLFKKRHIIRSLELEGPLPPEHKIALSRKTLDRWAAFLDSRAASSFWNRKKLPWLLLGQHREVRSDLNLFVRRYSSDLEFDSELMESVSSDSRLAVRGFLKIICGNILSTEAKLGLVLRLLKMPDREAQEIALFHVDKLLGEEDANERFLRVTSTLGERIRSRGENKVKVILGKPEEIRDLGNS